MIGIKAGKGAETGRLRHGVAAERIELRGKCIEPGQFAFLAIAAANRDPRVFENPEKLDLRRPNIDRVAVFGPGTHHCLGHYLARMELDILYRKLFARAARIVRRSDELRFVPNEVFRGVESLPVRITAR